MAGKTQAAYHGLTTQLARRTASRPYLALAQGALRRRRTLDAPIGRDPRSRVRMAIVPEGRGKGAVTHYGVERFGRGASAVTLLECRLEPPSWVRPVSSRHSRERGGAAAEALEHAEAGDRALASSLGHDRHAHAGARIAADRRVDRPSARRSAPWARRDSAESRCGARAAR